MAIECDLVHSSSVIHKNTKGHTATAGELAAKGFVYCRAGGAEVNSAVVDRANIHQKN